MSAQICGVKNVLPGVVYYLSYQHDLGTVNMNTNHEQDHAILCREISPGGYLIFS